MAAIWKHENPTLDAINRLSVNTMAETLAINFTAIGEDFISASMPVNKHTHQPYGLLHGGASAALCETVGSVASWLCIASDKQICVGLEINCNHIKAKRSGMVTATARPLHLGSTTHVWDIKVIDEQEKLVTACRLTVAVRNMKNSSI